MEIEFAEIVQDSPDEPLHLNVWVGGVCRSFLVEDVLAKMDAVEHSVHTDAARSCRNCGGLVGVRSCSCDSATPETPRR